MGLFFYHNLYNFHRVSLVLERVKPTDPTQQICSSNRPCQRHERHICHFPGVDGKSYSLLQHNARMLYEI